MRSSRYSRTSSITASTWLVLGAFAPAAMLAIAHAFQTFGRLPPCELCLGQRDVYWAAFWIAIIGIGVSRVWAGAPRTFLLLLGAAFAVEAALAAYHAGVEWKFWAGPTSCTGDHTRVTAADMASLLQGVRFHMVRCDVAAWRWLGLSMAGWNALAALGFTIVSLTATVGLRKLRR